MELDNPFDRALEVRDIPASMRYAATHITGTLELAWDAARAVFQDHAHPDQAIALCQMFLAEAQRRLDSA